METYKIDIQIGKSFGFGINVDWAMGFELQIRLPFTYIAIYPYGRRWFGFYNSFKRD